MTSLGSFAARFVDAPAWNETERPPASMRFGVEAEGGRAAIEPDGPRTERWLASSALKRPKMASIALSFCNLAMSASVLPMGVFARDVPRLRALPKGPFSSGMRRWFLSELVENMLAEER
jgi:hypothetical protein